VKFRKLHRLFLEDYTVGGHWFEMVKTVLYVLKAIIQSYNEKMEMREWKMGK